MIMSEQWLQIEEIIWEIENARSSEMNDLGLGMIALETAEERVFLHVVSEGVVEVVDGKQAFVGLHFRRELRITQAPHLAIHALDDPHNT